MQKLDAVLIDDDPLVRMVWKMAAKQKGKVILLVSSASEFLEKIDQIDPSTPLYIDSHLGEEVKGEDFARDLSTRGFAEIYLATGYRAESFGALPGIKAVVGKDPPF
jgi:CheY-like chemotaxis protein